MRVRSLLLFTFIGLCACSGERNDGDWPAYGGSPAGDRFSTLTQITRDNVAQLRQAWRFDVEQGDLQAQPIVINGVLYSQTPKLMVIALDGGTGEAKWTFDPHILGEHTSRGLSFWSEGKERRLFAGAGHYLYALNPDTGMPIESFGEQGRIDLRKQLRGDYADKYISLTSPGAIYRDMIIVGGRVSETTPASPGDIRAFDVRSGALRWTFHTIPHPGELGYDTWPAGAEQVAGGANNWTGPVLDVERGIVYVVTGSASDDFYGGNRPGANLFANSIIALDAKTGKRLWHFQAVHHDIWDIDFAAPAVLLRVVRNGRAVDAVAASNKSGYIFLFDRVTGEPLFPIEERAVPPSTIPGEMAWPTQPFPLAPVPLVDQVLTEEHLTTRSPEANAWARRKFKTFQNVALFRPFSVKTQTVLLPGFFGGVQWGGMATDQTRGILYTNANNIVSLGALADGVAEPSIGIGERTYRTQCAACHGASKMGSAPDFPSLADIGERLSIAEVATVIRGGKGRMPGFTDMPVETIEFLASYLVTKKDVIPQEAISYFQSGTDYYFTGYQRFVDPDGYPATKFPWGTLNAIDMNTGKYLWRIPFGEYPELVAKGLKDTGSESWGGPIVTAGGVLFIGATVYDRKFRAFDVESAELLWEASLPYSGVATPATYMKDGKQYVVIATSGNRDRKGPRGAAYVAFSLSTP